MRQTRHKGVSKGVILGFDISRASRRSGLGQARLLLLGVLGGVFALMETSNTFAGLHKTYWDDTDLHSSRLRDQVLNRNDIWVKRTSALWPLGVYNFALRSDQALPRGGGVNAPVI